MAASRSLPWGTAGPIQINRKWRDLAELVSGYSLILLVIWTPNPWQRRFYFVAMAWVVLVTVFSHESRKTMGLQSDGFIRSSWMIGVACAMVAVAMAVASQMHTLHYPHSVRAFLGRFGGYILWSFVQQFLLQSFVLLRLLRLLRNSRSAVVIAAGLFALAHLPSPILTVATILWGLAACSLFLRYRNLYSLAIVHAMLGICLVMTIPGYVDHNMRVGLGYLIYHPNIPVLSQPQ